VIKVLETRRTPEGYVRRRRLETRDDGTSITFTTVEIPEELFDKIRNWQGVRDVSERYHRTTIRLDGYIRLRNLFQEGFSPWKAAMISGAGNKTVQRAFKLWMEGVPVEQWDGRAKAARRMRVKSDPVKPAEKRVSAEKERQQTSSATGPAGIFGAGSGSTTEIPT
jgi:hypothetical protein